ncbi:MAG: hypothetical protein F6K21_29170 [Symploca sp. SIO2D2]|nr:hypothetical protein [Symploca sp. SIO2D2]
MIRENIIELNQDIGIDLGFELIQKIEEIKKSLYSKTEYFDEYFGGDEPESDLLEWALDTTGCILGAVTSGIAGVFKLGGRGSDEPQPSIKQKVFEKSWENFEQSQDKIFNTIQKVIVVFIDKKNKSVTNIAEQAVSLYEEFLERQQRYQGETTEQSSTEKAWILQQRQELGKVYKYDGHDTRDSYVTWIEPVNPVIVVELLSQSTKKQDLGEIETEGKEIEEGPDKPPSKWEVYESILKIPYYVVFNRRNNKIRIFHLVNGLYQEVELSEGRLYLPELGISLGLWQGSFRTINRLWLRWFTRDGELILSEEESALQETAEAQKEATEAKQETAEAQQEAAEAKQETAEAQKRVAQLREQLRQLGINPDEIDE